jgi:hypothetical protein
MLSFSFYDDLSSRIDANDNPLAMLYHDKKKFWKFINIAVRMNADFLLLLSLVIKIRHIIFTSLEEMNIFVFAQIYKTFYYMMVTFFSFS